MKIKIRKRSKSKMKIDRPLFAVRINCGRYIPVSFSPIYSSIVATSPPLMVPSAMRT
jgi:hypothetical protein